MGTRAYTGGCGHTGTCTGACTSTCTRVGVHGHMCTALHRGRDVCVHKCASMHKSAPGCTDLHQGRHVCLCKCAPTPKSALRCVCVRALTYRCARFHARLHTQNLGQDAGGLRGECGVVISGQGRFTCAATASDSWWQWGGEDAVTLGKFGVSSGNGLLCSVPVHSCPVYSFPFLSSPLHKAHAHHASGYS